MDQIKIGNFIAEKRKEKNLTQEQLAERLGVSNKTISKWECGRCMPDYSVIEQLCCELSITPGELISGCSAEHKSQSDEESILKLVKEVDYLKTRNIFHSGLSIGIVGFLWYCVSTVSTVPWEKTFLTVFSIAAIVISAAIFVWCEITDRRRK